MAESLPLHIVDLASNLIDDIELSRLPAEQLLFKAARLARLIEDPVMTKWLRFELNGYSGEPDSRALMLQYGRLESAEAQIGYFQPFAGISGAIASMQSQIQQLKVPDIQFSPSSANPNEFVTGYAGLTAQAITKPAQDVLLRLQALTTAMTNMAGIRSRVLSTIHAYASKIYYDRAFAGMAESFFEKHKMTIDELLRANASDVLEKIPAIYDRLATGDQEAVSQAMNSLRRMIKAFADAVYPPGEGVVSFEGQDYEIGSERTLNRIKLFLGKKCTSATRCERLNKNLRMLHERASAGAHTDITSEEAQALFLQTYLTLGEILSAASS